MVHPGGRPRTTAPSPEECEELGKEFVKWCSEETKEIRCRACQWYSGEKFILREVWKAMIKSPEFRPYYEVGRDYLSQRFIDGTVNQSIAHRYLRYVDPELAEGEDETKRFEAELKRKEQDSLQDNLVSLLTKLSSGEIKQSDTRKDVETK